MSREGRPAARSHLRILTAASMSLPVLVAVVDAPPVAVRAAAGTIAAPAYVRTIGTPGQSAMYPSGVAVDSGANVYVADTGNDRIEKYQAGTTTLLWSVGVRGAPIGGGTDSFQAPRDVATDGTRVYVADTDNAVVQVLNAADGSFVERVSAFGSGGAQSFADPIGISVGRNGATEEILVSDGVSGNVYVFDTSFSLLATVAPTASNEGTRDAATDSAGNIYTADYRGNAVDKYNPTGTTLLTSWGSSSTSDCHDVAKPYGIDVDANDHVYVASSDLEQVKVFDAGGTCLNVGATGSNAIGTMGTTSGDPSTLFQLRRVAVGTGSSPLVYAADLWGLKIVAYNSGDGSIASSTQPELGSGQYPAAGGLNENHGLAIDPVDNLVFTTNTANQRMERFNLDGSDPIDWGTKGVAESSASFNWAQGVAYDPADGYVWVANTRNNRIDAFSLDGSVSETSYPSATRLNSPFNWPMAVAFDPTGNMYVADTFNNDIQAFSVTGSGASTSFTLLWTEGTRGAGTDQFAKPWDVTYDAAGHRLLVADTGNSRLVSLDPATGRSFTVLSIPKGTAAGRVVQPEGVATDKDGDVWVADTGNNRIEEFGSSGGAVAQMIGGYGTSGTSSFNAPQGIAFDSTGLLYVADTNNNRIQVYTPAQTSGGSAPGPYHAIAPVRICDTRASQPSNQCTAGGALGQTPLNVQIAGLNGVPSTGVVAAVVNVTAVSGTEASFLTVWPAGDLQPSSSNLNFPASVNIANLVEVGLGPSGAISVANANGTVDLVVDLEGYVTTATFGAGGDGGLFNPIVPVRVCDTRPAQPSNQCTLPHGVAGDTSLHFKPSAASSVPASGVSAVVLNVTAISPSTDMFVTVYPGGTVRPTASNINDPAHVNLPNRVIVPVGADGSVNVYVSGTVDIAVDVGGWYTDGVASGQTGAMFTALSPQRICDTRPANVVGYSTQCSTRGRVMPGQTLNVGVAGLFGVPAMGGAGAPVAVVLNVTAVSGSANSLFTVFPGGTGRPGASDLNFTAGENIPNLVVVKIGADGTFNVYNDQGSVDVVVDLCGYYS